VAYDVTIDVNLVALLLISFIAGTAQPILWGGGRNAPLRWLQNGIIGVLGAFLGKIIFNALNITGCLKL
jgi:uncharacterized membrane protein YeaQ/YmgE (transglycosylase-associated protein family)